MPHFHIPLQSGSDAVLKLMNRRYDTKMFADRIAHIRSVIPDAFIGVDIIAGARGETLPEWEKSFAFAESLPVSRFHIFPYSERPGTRALELGDSVPRGERHKRVALLGELSDRKMKDFLGSFIGQQRPVLWEHSGSDPDRMHGFTDNYIRVTTPVAPELYNKVTMARISGFDLSDKESMRGEVII